MSETLIKIGAALYEAEDYTVPSERTFRSAWEANTNTKIISVDMAAAKEIWREKIRLARVEPFVALDTAFMKALETGASTVQIIEDKQALRDAPADSGIDAATTPAELSAVQPAGLTVE
jgi:hypothetical protein